MKVKGKGAGEFGLVKRRPERPIPLGGQIAMTHKKLTGATWKLSAVAICSLASWWGYIDPAAGFIEQSSSSTHTNVLFLLLSQDAMNPPHQTFY